MQIINSKAVPITMIVGSGGAVRGHLAVVSSGKAVKAAAAVTDATVLGVFAETKDADELVQIEQITSDSLLTSEYTGSSKTSLANTDIGSVFDLTDSDTVNLDDTTGGCCLCQGYNNTIKQIIFKIPAAKLYL